MTEALQKPATDPPKTKTRSLAFQRAYDAAREKKPFLLWVWFEEERRLRILVSHDGEHTRTYTFSDLPPRYQRRLKARCVERWRDDLTAEITDEYLQQALASAAMRDRPSYWIRRFSLTLFGATLVSAVGILRYVVLPEPISGAGFLFWVFLAITFLLFLLQGLADD
jgi:hypothetical protein